MFRPLRIIALTLGLLPFGPPRVEVTHHGLPAGIVARIETHVHVEMNDMDVRARTVRASGGTLQVAPLALRTVELGHRYELRHPGPVGTPHLVVVTVEQGPDGEHGVAEAVIAVDGRGQIRDVTYPKGRWYDMRNAPRRATDRELAEALHRVR